MIQWAEIWNTNTSTSKNREFSKSAIQKKQMKYAAYIGLREYL